MSHFAHFSGINVDTTPKHNSFHPAMSIVSDDCVTFDPKCSMEEGFKLAKLHGDSKLHSLAHASKWSDLTALFEADEDGSSSNIPDIEAVNSAGRCPLHYACMNHAPLSVIKLLLSPSSASILDNSNLSPLHLACKNPLTSPPVVALLIANNPSAATTADEADTSPLPAPTHNRFPLDYARAYRISLVAIQMMEVLTTDEICAAECTEKGIAEAIERKLKIEDDEATRLIGTVIDGKGRVYTQQIQASMWNWIESGDAVKASETFHTLQMHASKLTKHMTSTKSQLLSRYLKRGGAHYSNLMGIQDFKRPHGEQLLPPNVDEMSNEDTVQYLLCKAKRMEDGFRESIEEIAAVFNGAGDYATIAKAYNICGELGIIREGTMVEVADKKGVAQLVTWTVPDGTFQTVCSVYGDFEYHVESSAIRVLYDEMGWQIRNPAFRLNAETDDIVEVEFGPPKTFKRALDKLKGVGLGGRNENAIFAKHVINAHVTGRRTSSIRSVLKGAVKEKVNKLFLQKKKPTSLTDLNRARLVCEDPRVMELMYHVIDHKFTILGVSNKLRRPSSLSERAARSSETPCLLLTIDIGGGYKEEHHSCEVVTVVRGVGCRCEYFIPESKMVEEGNEVCMVDAWYPATITKVHLNGNIDLVWEDEEWKKRDRAVNVEEGSTRGYGGGRLRRASVDEGVCVGWEVLAYCKVRKKDCFGIIKEIKSDGDVVVEFPGFVAEVELVFRDIHLIEREMQNYKKVLAADCPLNAAEPVKF